MRKSLLIGMMAMALSVTLSSCYRSNCELWEDTKTCGRYMGKGVRSFFGQHLDSNEYANYYAQWEENEYQTAKANQGNEYVPLADVDAAQYELAIRDYPMSRESPGDPGSAIPGIEAFADPSGELARLFSKIHFETDHYAIKGSDNIETLRGIASYMNAHAKTYVFVAGHADERGAAAYNLSLGAKRANAVRAFLIDNGVHPDRLFTISYGLERPLSLGHNEGAWQQNRRAEFKLYER